MNGYIEYVYINILIVNEFLLLALSHLSPCIMYYIVCIYIYMIIGIITAKLT